MQTTILIAGSSLYIGQNFDNLHIARLSKHIRTKAIQIAAGDIIDVFIIDDNISSILKWAGKIKELARHSRESGNPVGLNKMHFCIAGFPLSRE